MISLSEEILKEIQREAEKSYPNECCGFIFGNIENNEKTALHIKPCNNSFTDSEQYHRFVISPEDMITAEMYARKTGTDITGIYHSHPDCEAVPSEYDRSHALPVYSYIIVSVKKGKADSTYSWELDENTNYTKFKNEILSLVKGDDIQCQLQY